MKDKLKNFLKNWMPPIILRKIVNARGLTNRFEGGYTSWQEAVSKSSGYHGEEILEKTLSATLKVKNGNAIYERDSVIFDEIEYFWPVTSALMWAAARNNGCLNVLDFGGALGSSYFQNKKFLASLTSVKWGVIEQPHYVEAGNQYIQDEQLKFYQSIDDYESENTANVILLSSVLQYLESPINIIKRLSLTKTCCLIIDRTPFSEFSEDEILIQRVPDAIYSASYPMRVFSKEKFLKILQCDWKVVTEFSSQENKVKSTSGFNFSFQGMILELKSD